MKRLGSKYQKNDRFVMDRSYGRLSKGEPVIIDRNLGKGKHWRTQIIAVSENDKTIVEQFPVTYLGRRLNNKHK